MQLESFLDIQKVPSHLDAKYRSLIHLTDWEGAEKITSQKRIFGDYCPFSPSSSPIHANFFAKSREDFEIPRRTTVALQFKWLGEQYFCYKNLLGESVKGPEYVNKLFHLCYRQEEFPREIENGYAQSILYPNSDLLRLEKVFFTAFSEAFVSSSKSIFNRNYSKRKQKDIVRLSDKCTGSIITVV
ncbi:hypothetical protein [Alteromonas sp. A079]|uniref:hypothetical protein n=1 Tax=Alteromonas sp. A079 TaxID=3410268 RepID=UPI003BA103DA